MRKSVPSLLAFYDLEMLSKITFVCIIIIISKFSIYCQYIYINGAAFEFILGLGLPVNVDLAGGTVFWFTNLQAIYHLPDNISYFEPYNVIQKRSVKNTLSRLEIYQGFVKYLKRLGITGSQCIHQIICEIARGKLDHFDFGLLGIIAKIIFSPLNDSRPGLKEFKNAQMQGTHNNSNCKLIFQDCEISENSVFLD